MVTIINAFNFLDNMDGLSAGVGAICAAGLLGVAYLLAGSDGFTKYSSAEKLRTIISNHTGQPLDKVAKDTDRDFYLSAEQAVEYGLVDEILVKEEPEEYRESKD